MTKKVLLLAIFILLCGVFFTNPAFAFVEKGDTLVIEQADQDATPFNEIIAGDTLADGTRKHLVYELEPDGWYPLSGTLTAATYDLNVVGGKRSAGQSRPVILVTSPFGGWFMMSGGMDITIKSVHWMQAEETAGGNIGSWARAGVELTGVDSKVVIHDCIWDFNTGFAMLMNKDGIKLTVTNCLFRFSKPLDNSVWAGQGIDISAALLDTVIIRNCTWYGGGPFMLKTWESTDVLFVMDHCNFVDFVQWPIHSVHWVNSEFTNNLFYNAYTMGEDSAQVKGQDPEELPFGVLDADTLYFDAEGNIDDTKEAARRIIVKNNNNFVKQNIKDYWAVCEADPATYHEFRAPDPTFYDGFMNSRTRAMFEDDATWPNLEMENTTSLDPEFEDYFDYSDTLIAYSKAFYSYAWPNAEPTMFMMDPDGDPLIPTDPMVYDLKIGNATLRTASITGGPIGDLTWELPNGYNSTQAEIKSVTGIKRNDSNIPEAFSLEQNYPNPFNPTTNINFAVNKPSHIKLTVYNQLGQKVATLVNEQLIAGNYKVTWDASKMSSGIYFYRINAGNHTQTHKMILLK